MPRDLMKMIVVKERPIKVFLLYNIFYQVEILDLLKRKTKSTCIQDFEPTKHFIAILFAY